MKESEEWVLYDGECGFCLGWAERLEPWLRSHGFGLAPLQSAWVQDRLKLPPDELLEEMRVITKTDQILGGGDALLYLITTTWWGWPVYVLSFFPGVTPLIRAAYRVVAQRRHCISGACKLPDHLHTTSFLTDGLGWLPFLVLPAGSIFFRSQIPAWVFMWILSFAIFISLKWLTLWNHRVLITKTDLKRPFFYLFFWPGMDAQAFLTSREGIPQPPLTAWMAALSKTLLGGVLFWGIARCVPDHLPLLRGWVGLFGLIFLLHFGSFHLLALFWQRQGIDAQPLMNNPLRAISLSDFWGHRWNLAFNTLAYRLAFHPLHKRWGTTGAMLAAFCASGLIHDFVISFPAQGGYGLPTLYFLLQGAGLGIERSAVGRKLGLGAGFQGWFFAMLLTAGPAIGLFHPPFIHRIIIPFMKAFGAF